MLISDTLKNVSALARVSAHRAPHGVVVLACARGPAPFPTRTRAEAGREAVYNPSLLQPMQRDYSNASAGQRRALFCPDVGEDPHTHACT